MEKFEALNIYDLLTFLSFYKILQSLEYNVLKTCNGIFQVLVLVWKIPKIPSSETRPTQDKG